MTKAMMASIKGALLALAASAALVACGGGGDGGVAPAPAPGPGTGTLRVALTDAPNCRVGNDDLDKVYVTVERVRVHQSSDAEPSTGGWTDVVISPARKINLLDLTNGRLEELGTTPIPAGNYTQVRLVLSANQGNQTANSLVLDGQTVEIPLRTPSAAQSGLKIVRPFTVQPNTLVDLVIDFDACRSIVQLGRGNGGYLLKPILSADLRTVAGIVGFVDPALTNVTVSAQKNGKVVRSTIPSSTGEFVLAYLDAAASPYDVVITSPARGTSVVPAVPVSTVAVTPLSTAGQPIRLPVAGTPASRTASGTLGPVLARETGVVRALQVVGVVPKIEVATVNVDAQEGTYTLTLPTAVPLLASFSTTLPLAFAPAPAPAPAYTLEASATGYTTQTNGIGTGSASVTWNPTLVVAP
jgi:hypothetical protein